MFDVFRKAEYLLICMYLQNVTDLSTVAIFKIDFQKKSILSFSHIWDVTIF